MPDVTLPDGERIPDRRDAGARREGGRRASDRAPGLYMLQAALWAICGALVVLYLFLVALNAVTPSKAPAATIVVLVLAVIWLAHAWRRLYSGGFVSRGDRERRGF